VKPDDQGQPLLPQFAVPPRWAIDYLNAVRRYYRPGIDREPSNADIAVQLHIQPRTWDHRKKKLRDGSMGRDWIEAWPPPRDWHPTWEHLLEPPNDDGSRNGVRKLRFEEEYDENGVFIRKTLLSMVAAGLTGSVLADMADGRLDGVLHLHRVFLTFLEQCAARL
jgi:hypothetical protein